MKIVEVDFGKGLWKGAKAAPSVHRHVGYITEDNPQRLVIASEFTTDSRGTILRIEHSLTFKKPLTVKVTPLTASPQEAKIIDIECEDPFGTGGTWSKEKLKELLPALVHWVGYIVHEDDKYLRLAWGLFEYETGNIEFEEPHVIPKQVIKKRIPLGE